MNRSAWDLVAGFLLCFGGWLIWWFAIAIATGQWFEGGN